MLAPKKSGKSFCNALAVLYTIVVLGGRKAEGYILANDLHQAASRVFQACCELVAASPVLRHAATMTGTRGAADYVASANLATRPRGPAVNANNVEIVRLCPAALAGDHRTTTRATTTPRATRTGAG